MTLRRGDRLFDEQLAAVGGPVERTPGAPVCRDQEPRFCAVGKIDGVDVLVRLAPFVTKKCELPAVLRPHEPAVAGFPVAQEADVACAVHRHATAWGSRSERVVV